MLRSATAVRPRALGLSDLRLSVDVPAGVVTIAGVLDRSTAHHLSDAVGALRSSPSPLWTLDLSGIDFCDVEGLRVVHGARVLAGRCGRVLHARAASPALSGLLDFLDGFVRGDVEAVPVLVAVDG